MRPSIIISTLLFALNVSAANFVCTVDSYVAQVNDPSTELQSNYESLMTIAVDKWFKKVGGEFGVFEKFKVTISPNSDYYKGEAIDLTFEATAASKTGVKYSFKLSDHVFVQQANHPLDNSIMTCGPFSGLPMVLKSIEVLDDSGNKVDSALVPDVWGHVFCYQYKLEI